MNRKKIINKVLAKLSKKKVSGYIGEMYDSTIAHCFSPHKRLAREA